MKHFSTGAGRTSLLHVRCCNGNINTAKLYKKPKLVEVVHNSDDVQHLHDDENTKKPKKLKLRLDPVTSAKQIADAISTIDNNQYGIIKRDELPFSGSNTGHLIDWAHNEREVDHAYEIDLKAANVATHTDKYVITDEVFIPISMELETAVVATSKLMLSLEAEGDPPKKIRFKPKKTTSTSSDQSKNSSKK